MTSSTSDSFRNVTRYLGQDYRFVPTYLRNRDPITPATSPDTKPKEQQGHYPLSSLWTNTTNTNVWVLARYVNNLATWILITSGGTGPMLKIAVPLGTTPIVPDITGLVTFTSTLGTIQITGSTAGNPNFINFDITGGGVAIEKITGDDAVAVVPTAGNINLLGLVVPNGTHAKAVFTESPVASTEKIDIQVTAAIASTDITKVGLAAFNSAQFTVDANGFVSITNFSPFQYKNVTHNGTNPSPYTVTANDEYISCDTTAATAGTITILLPNAPTQFREFVIKDRTGAASTNNITVTTVGGVVLIDGATSYVIAGNFGSLQLLFNGTSYEIY